MNTVCRCISLPSRECRPHGNRVCMQQTKMSLLGYSSHMGARLAHRGRAAVRPLYLLVTGCVLRSAHKAFSSLQLFCQVGTHSSISSMQNISLTPTYSSLPGPGKPWASPQPVEAALDPGVLTILKMTQTRNVTLIWQPKWMKKIKTGKLYRNSG